MPVDLSYAILFSVQMLLVGMGAGLISGALGLGGGILMVPAFMAFVDGMDVHTAKGTSLFIIIFIALLNTFRMHSQLPPNAFRIAGWLALGSVAGSYLGAWITGMLPGPLVIGIFLVLLVILAIRTFLLQPRSVKEDEVHERHFAAMGIGLATGIFGGATGTGGGSVLIPLALMAGIVANERAVVLSNLVMIGTALAGTIRHLQEDVIYNGAWTIGHVCFALVPLVFIGSQIGSPLGKRLNSRLSLRRRRVAMGLLLSIIAVQLSWKLYQGL